MLAYDFIRAAKHGAEVNVHDRYYALLSARLTWRPTICRINTSRNIRDDVMATADGARVRSRVRRARDTRVKRNVPSNWTRCVTCRRTR